MELSGDTLLWDNRRMLGKPIIVLARQAQPTHDYSDILGKHRSCSRTTHMFRCTIVRSFQRANPAMLKKLFMWF